VNFILALVCSPTALGCARHMEFVLGRMSVCVRNHTWAQTALHTPALGLLATPRMSALHTVFAHPQMTARVFQDILDHPASRIVAVGISLMTLCRVQDEECVCHQTLVCARTDIQVMSVNIQFAMGLLQMRQVWFVEEKGTAPVQMCAPAQRGLPASSAL